MLHLICVKVWGLNSKGVSTPKARGIQYANQGIGNKYFVLKMKISSH